MQSPPVPRSQRTIIVSLVVLALLGAGLLVWWRHGRTPAAEEVTAFLNRTVGGGRVRFSEVKMAALLQGEAGQQILVVTTAKTIGSLYTRIDAADYLRHAIRLDAAAAGEARRLLSNQGSSPQPELQGAAPFPADPFAAVILRLASPAGTSFAFQGVLDAHRDGGAWAFALVSGGFEGAGPQGEARSTFGESSYAVGEAGDEARLQVLVADFEAFAGRVAGSRRDLASARAAASEDRRRAFLARIAPGRVFRGTAVEAGTQHETPLYLEIVGLSPENEVRAVLRNDNSWHIARAFQGTWSADEQFEKPILNLASLPNQAVRNAGPFLDNTQVWRFALNVDSRGELAEQNRFFQYRFQAITAEQVGAVQARLEGEFERTVAATEPGGLYFGSAVSRTSGATEPIFLRFGPRAPGSEALAAEIESTVRAWKRPWHGTIAPNVHRAGGVPISLQTSPNEAVEEAPPGSVLGDRGDLTLRLGLEQGALVGGDERFIYRLAVAGAADLQRLEDSRIERVRRLTGVMRNGIAYDGVMREDRGYVFRTRLEFTRIDRPAGVITARFRSLDRLNVFREFLGTWEPTGDSIVLTATDRGVLDKTLVFNIPFFLTHGGATLHLVLTGNSLTGRIAGEPHWAMDFPAEVFLSAPTGAAESNQAVPDGGVLPSLPKAEGAYLLSQGGWVSLPSNHGHVVLEPAPKATEDEEAASTMRELKGIAGDEPPEKNSEKKGKEKQMVSFLEFDGKDPRPMARGRAMVLLYVGPESAGEPALELARARTLDDGRRRIKITGSAPTTIEFGEQRLAAYVRPVAANATVLTTTSATAPGAYVFNAGVGYELTQE
jgi:hypothetical protein